MISQNTDFAVANLKIINSTDQIVQNDCQESTISPLSNQENSKHGLKKCISSSSSYSQSYNKFAAWPSPLNEEKLTTITDTGIVLLIALKKATGWMQRVWGCSINRFKSQHTLHLSNEYCRMLWSGYSQKQVLK